MNNIAHYAVEVRVVPATATRGTRLNARWADRKDRGVTVPYPYHLDSRSTYRVAADELLKHHAAKYGVSFRIASIGWTSDGAVFTVELP